MATSLWRAGTKLDALSKQDRRGRLSNISRSIFTVFLVISSIFGDDDIRGSRDSLSLLKMIEVILTCTILYTRPAIQTNPNHAMASHHYLECVHQMSLIPKHIISSWWVGRVLGRRRHRTLMDWTDLHKVSSYNLCVYHLSPLQITTSWDSLEKQSGLLLEHHEASLVVYEPFMV